MGSEKRGYIKISKEKYHILVNSIIDVIVELDSNGTFTFVNSRFFDLFGYQPEEIVRMKALISSIQKTYQKLQKK